MENKKAIYVVVGVLIILLVVCLWFLFGKNGSVSSKDLKLSLVSEIVKEGYYIDDDGYTYYGSKIGDKYIGITKVNEEVTENGYSYAFLLNKGGKKILLSEKRAYDSCYVLEYSLVGDNENYVGLNNKCMGTGSDYYSKIYTIDLDLIDDDFIDYSIDDSSNNITFTNSDSIVTYDPTGKKVNEVNKYKDIIYYYNGYVLYLDGKTVKINDVKKDKLVATLGTLTTDEEVIDGFIFFDDFDAPEGAYIHASSDKITYNEAYNDINKEDAYDAAVDGFGYDDISELVEYDRVYLYTYSFAKNTSSKRAIFYGE